MENVNETIDKDNEILGKVIRDLRHKKGLNMEALANKADLSVALISKTERGLVNPSIQTLRKIAKALGVPTAFFFAREAVSNKEGASVNNKQIYSYPRSKVSYVAIMSKCSDKVRVFMIDAQAGASGGDEAIGHQGFEQGFIIEGIMELQVGSELYKLEKGDTISFPSNIPHRWQNASSEVCKSIWAIYADYNPEEAHNGHNGLTEDGWMDITSEHARRRHS